MTRPLTVLIVGGYGTFGGRLAHLLRDVNGLTLLIGGRSLSRAQEFCSAGGNEAPPSRPAIEGIFSKLRPVLFNRDADLLSQLRELAPDIAVDASGPFQSYGPR